MTRYFTCLNQLGLVEVIDGRTDSVIATYLEPKWAKVRCDILNDVHKRREAAANSNKKVS